jgi:hypothetical protein
MKSTRLAVEIRAALFVAPIAAGACLAACINNGDNSNGSDDAGFGEDATMPGVDGAPSPGVDSGGDTTAPADAGTDTSVPPGNDSGQDAGPGTITGQVVDFMQFDYGLTPTATVSVVGGPQTTTDATGRFTLTGVAPGPRVLVNVTVPTTEGVAYGSSQLVVDVAGGATVQVTAHVLEGCVATMPVTASAPASTSLQSACPGRTAAYCGVTFDLGALVEADGGTFTGNAQVEMIPVEVPPVTAALDAGLDYTWFEAFPGDMGAAQADGGALPLQSLGACEIRVYDTNMVPLTIAPGHTATIDIPAFRPQGNGESFTGYSYDAATGRWVEQGPGTFTTETADENTVNVFETQVSRLGWWNVDEATAGEGCVIGTITSGGAPFPNLLVTGTGVGWGGVSTGVTGADGTYCLDGLAGSSMTITALAQSGASAFSRARAVGTVTTSAGAASCAVNRGACANAGAASIAPLEPITPGCATGRIVEPPDDTEADGGNVPVAATLALYFDYSSTNDPGSGFESFSYVGQVTTGADGTFCVSYPPNVTVTFYDPTNEGFCNGGQTQNSPSFAAPAPPSDGGVAACPTGCTDVGDIGYFCTGS